MAAFASMRWKAFVGRMSPLHSFLFQLLLLALLVGNVYSLVMNLQRLRHSYLHPASALSVQHLSVPDFTLVVQSVDSAFVLSIDTFFCGYWSAGDKWVACSQTFFATTQ